MSAPYAIEFFENDHMKDSSNAPFFLISFFSNFRFTSCVVNFFSEQTNFTPKKKKHISPIFSSRIHKIVKILP